MPPMLTPDPAALSREIGGRIAKRRKALGLTQANLAERIGVDPESVSRFERGKHLPSLPTLANIAAQLGTPVAALMPGETGTEDLPGAVRPLLDALAGLGEEDRLFAIRSAEALCGHLARRADRAGRLEDPGV